MLAKPLVILTTTPPGANRTPEIQRALNESYAAKPRGYVPRTHLKDGAHARYVNRLIDEPSPYLAQHAHNPVDWWPFGEAALAEAQARDLPIFLSAGYATCHWCHVMEEESFDDEEVAALLNQHFVAIKLDREQRPDIDQFYMTATTLQHRHGGWPNSIWALGDGRPFHTGTYFPKPQFLQLLGAIAQSWTSPKRKEFEDFSERLTQSVRAVQARLEPPEALDRAADTAVQDLTRAFNTEHGGFSQGTQFPQEGHLLFLLDHWRRTGNAEALTMVETTLANIAAGGIHDHVGGGFHRYSVDVNWRTPHFEKMLYNQALLLRAFAEAANATGRQTFERAADRCVAYLLRDMTASDGAFYAAEDADSLDATGKLEEGAFYVWPPAEAKAALGGEDHHFQFGLYEPATLEAGPVLHLDPALEADPNFDAPLETLRLARDARQRPLRDDKIILGWNALMIRALAEAALILDRPDWIRAGERALEACLTRLTDGQTLHRIHAEGQAIEAANLADLAWTGLAAHALHAATGKPQHLKTAEAMADRIEAEFAYENRFALAKDGPLGPILEMEDGATPAGESSTLELLAKLDRKAPAASLLKALSGSLAKMPIIRLDTLRAGETLAMGAAHPILRIEGATVIRRRDAIVIKLDPGHHVEPETFKLDGKPMTPSDIIPMPASDTTVVDISVCTDSYCNAPQTLTFRLRP